MHLLDAALVSPHVVGVHVFEDRSAHAVQESFSELIALLLSWERCNQLRNTRASLLE
jgi:hypothetical protein